MKDLSQVYRQYGPVIKKSRNLLRVGIGDLVEGAKSFRVADSNWLIHSSIQHSLHGSAFTLQLWRDLD